MPFDEVREQHKTAQYLPSPLYVLYVQTSAYKDACGKKVKNNHLYIFNIQSSELLVLSTTAFVSNRVKI